MRMSEEDEEGEEDEEDEERRASSRSGLLHRAVPTLAITLQQSHLTTTDESALLALIICHFSVTETALTHERTREHNRWIALIDRPPPLIFLVGLA